MKHCSARPAHQQGTPLALILQALTRPILDYLVNNDLLLPCNEWQAVSTHSLLASNTCADLLITAVHAVELSLTKGYNLQCCLTGSS